MSDVYDLAAQNWCHICDAPHLPCEFPDMRYECLTCNEPIDYGEECLCEVDDHCHEHCPLNNRETPDE